MEQSTSQNNDARTQERGHSFLIPTAALLASQPQTSSQTEDTESHLHERVGCSGTLVAVRVNEQIVSPGIPNATEWGCTFVVPTAASFASQPQPGDVASKRTEKNKGGDQNEDGGAYLGDCVGRSGAIVAVCA